MDYYDGNTVTGLWNYAQHYAMSDNFFDTEFGPPRRVRSTSSPAQTYGGTALTPQAIWSRPGHDGLADPSGTGTVFGDGDPVLRRVLHHELPAITITGPNIGDLLNAKGVTWGWFEGGFTPTSATQPALPVCGASHNNIGGVSVTDYIPHHEPFQYYNPRPTPTTCRPASGR